MPPRALKPRRSPISTWPWITTCELLPVINKIDLPAADVERVREEIDADLGLDPFEAIPVSAKTGLGIDDLLAGIVRKAACRPRATRPRRSKALVFDAHFDRYRGVILQCRIMEGTLKPREMIHFMHSGCEYTVEEVGLQPVEAHSQGATQRRRGGLYRRWNQERSGDRDRRYHHAPRRPAAEPVPGYKKAKQVVFSSIYPMNTDEYKDLQQGAGQAGDQRCGLDLRERQFGGPGFRISLRVPRPACTWT